MQLAQNLDIFEHIVPDSELILKGIYRPLVISGNTLVWGYSLIDAARFLKIESLWCNALPELTAHEQLLLALKLENRQGRYSWTEKERIVKYLGTVKRIDPDMALLLEGRAEPDLYGKYEAYLNLAAPLKILVQDESLSFKTALEIQKLPVGIFELFTAYPLKMTFSERRQLLVWFYEVCERERCTESQCLDKFTALLNDAHPLQKIRQWRYPVFSNLEEQFNNFKMRWLKGTGIELKVPVNFEGAEFSVSFSFTEKNLERKLKSLEKIKEHVDELTALL